MTAITLMVFTLAAAIEFFVRETWLRLALGVQGIAIAIWMYRIPSRDRPLHVSR